jgi:hypothetical protein
VHELHFALSAKHAQGRSDDLNTQPQARGYLACAPKLPVHLAPHVIDGPHTGLVVHFRPFPMGTQGGDAQLMSVGL